MDMGFLFAPVKMFWNYMLVMVVHRSTYTRNAHFQVVNFS